MVGEAQRDEEGEGEVDEARQHSSIINTRCIALRATVIASLLLSYHHLYKSRQEHMFPEPRYLQLEEQLFPSITLYKELVFDNPLTGFHYEIFERVAYDSSDRSIDLTESVEHVLKKEYGQQTELQILVFDPIVQDYRFLAYFPVDANITLGQQFLQLDVLIFRVRPLQQLSDPFLELEAAPKSNISTEECELGEAGTGWQKCKRRKSTIREMLQVVDQWRKIWVHSNCKMSIQEGAAEMGISKRSLLFYIHNVKLAEKYQFDFHANLDRKIGQLTSFVHEKTQLKKNEEAELINKLKTYYK